MAGFLVWLSPVSQAFLVFETLHMVPVESGVQVNCLLSQHPFPVAFAKGKCFGYRGEGDMKSSSFSPSHQKPRHTLGMLWCPRAASGSLVLLRSILHAWLCSHTYVCTLGRSAWALAACVTGILTYFLFPWKRRWRSFKKLIVPFNFKSLKIASYWEFNSFLNVNLGKYLLFKHEYRSAFSHHWKCIILFRPLNSRDHSR